MKVSNERLLELIKTSGFGTTLDEAEAILRELLAARRVVEAARVRGVVVGGRQFGKSTLFAALAAYDEATR